MYKNGKWYRIRIWKGVAEEMECAEHVYAYCGKIPCVGSIKCIYCGKPKDEEADVANAYKEIGTEDFDRILMRILGDLSSGAILSIPGVYEILSEHFNNEVLEVWECEQELEAATKLAATTQARRYGLPQNLEESS